MSSTAFLFCCESAALVTLRPERLRIVRASSMPMSFVVSRRARSAATNRLIPARIARTPGAPYFDRSAPKLVRMTLSTFKLCSCRVRLRSRLLDLAPALRFGWFAVECDERHYPLNARRVACWHWQLLRWPAKCCQSAPVEPAQDRRGYARYRRCGSHLSG